MKNDLVPNSGECAGAARVFYTFKTIDTPWALRVETESDCDVQVYAVEGDGEAWSYTLGGGASIASMQWGGAGGNYYTTLNGINATWPISQCPQVTWYHDTGPFPAYETTSSTGTCTKVYEANAFEAGKWRFWSRVSATDTGHMSCEARNWLGAGTETFCRFHRHVTTPVPPWLGDPGNWVGPIPTGDQLLLNIHS